MLGIFMVDLEEFYSIYKKLEAKYEVKGGSVW